MSSRVLRIAPLILTLCAASAGAGKDHFAEQISALLLKHTLSQLRNAQTIVLGDFKESQGTVITRVIRGGDHVKPGQLWNGGAFPRGPVLIYQRDNDLIGNVSRDLMSTGHYPLDETQRFILRETTDIDTGKKKTHLIPLDEILRLIETPPAPAQ